MENLSREELVALFGEEAGNELFKQQEAANSSGGAREPFPLLKKVVDGDLGIGKFGSFVFGLEYAKDKDENGDKVISNVGTNVGESFEFIAITVGYRFKRWSEASKKSEWSNIFTTPEGFKTAITYSGVPVPAEKADRDAAGWKTVKVIGGMVKAGDEWFPVILEVDGKLYFTFNNIVDKAPNKGVLNSVLTLVSKTEKQGNTKFTVFDEAKSKFSDKATSDKVLAANRGIVSDVVIKMKAYFEQNNYKAKDGGTSGASSNTQPAQPDTTVSDDNNW